MQYFYIKVGTQNCLVEECLIKPKRKTVCIFFGNTTAENYSLAPNFKTVQQFIDIAKPGARKKTVIMVVHHSKVWFLKPAGNVVFGDPESTFDGLLHTRKILPVEVIGGAPKRLLDLPPIISGIPSNQFLARGTFREIKSDWGCKKAIDVGAGIPTRGSDHWDPSLQGFDQVVECLGSLELETLVAKIFEAAGCFVPANRGGLIKDVDIFARNDLARTINVGGIQIPRRDGITIQVKRWPASERERGQADYMIGAAVEGDRCFGSKWLLDQAAASDEVWQWFARSLNWLPADFRRTVAKRLSIRDF